LGIAGSDGVSVVFAAASTHPASLAGSINAITLPFSVHVSFAAEGAAAAVYLLEYNTPWICSPRLLSLPLSLFLVLLIVLFLLLSVQPITSSQPSGRLFL